MSQDAVELAKAVLAWWENAQYWEAYPGKNQFDEDPLFVTAAKEILEPQDE